MTVNATVWQLIYCIYCSCRGGGGGGGGGNWRQLLVYCRTARIESNGRRTYAVRRSGWYRVGGGKSMR